MSEGVVVLAVSDMPSDDICESEGEVYADFL